MPTRVIESEDDEESDIVTSGSGDPPVPTAEAEAVCSHEAGLREIVWFGCVIQGLLDPLVLFVGELGEPGEPRVLHNEKDGVEVSRTTRNQQLDLASRNGRRVTSSSCNHRRPIGARGGSAAESCISRWRCSETMLYKWRLGTSESDNPNI